MNKKKYLITGGAGFIGSALVRTLVKQGHQVTVLDNGSRGNARRLDDVADEIEFIEADIRDPQAVISAAKGIDALCHLAYINGTEFFYSRPDQVLDVAVRGMMSVLDACRQHQIPELYLASSSEVYQTPPMIPTAETVPLVVPDVHNPRYSYGGGKIISELLAIHLGAATIDRVVIFRPHNVYGPDMGAEHVIPQFLLRMKKWCESNQNPIPFEIQGTGNETRSFVYIDDFIHGLCQVIEKGEHLGIYHIGTIDEIKIADLAHEVAKIYQRPIELICSPTTQGSTPRRCPDISKLSALGYQPKISIQKGLQLTAQWYDQQDDKRLNKGHKTEEPTEPQPCKQA